MTEEKLRKQYEEQRAQIKASNSSNYEKSRLLQQAEHNFHSNCRAIIDNTDRFVNKVFDSINPLQW